MGADIDRLLAPQRWDPKRCTPAQALAEIADDKTRARVAAACDNPLVIAANVALVFKDLIGDSPSPASIRRHQTRRDNNNPCSCP